MKILIDIGHPAHVHLFKHFAWEMQKKGHRCLFTCRDKEFEIYLLEHYHFEFRLFGKKYASKPGKIWGMFEFGVKEILAGLNFKPDIFLSHGSMYAAHAAFLLNRPHISLEDTGNWEQVRLYLPFTKCVLTSDVFPKDYGKKQVRFKSHNEIAYLHPHYYQPGGDFKDKAGIKEDEKYVLLRFVAWNATHDAGQKGLSFSDKALLVENLSRTYKVLISSESKLPDEFEKYRVSFAPHQVHDALYYADMFIGEGTTMAMEAAVLGTPSVYVNTLQYSNVRDMEKYNLLFNYSFEKNIAGKIAGLLSEGSMKERLKLKREQMLAEKTNLTAFLVWFVENYPGSFRIMKENPDYQERFR